MQHLIQEIDSILATNNTERQIAACIRMGAEVYGNNDIRVNDAISFRNIERPSKRFYAARTFLEELKAYLIAKSNNATPQPLSVESLSNQTRKVFLVHGHDDAVRQTVARYLEKLEFEVIELSEQPNKGQTVIEKLEAHADVGLAVILLTPDDVGAKAGSSDFKARARQNVILELGYFLGKLDRKQVVSLYKPDIELPSDYHGVIYIPYDSDGGWKGLLSRELVSMGYEIKSM